MEPRPPICHTATVRDADPTPLNVPPQFWEGAYLRTKARAGSLCVCRLMAEIADLAGFSGWRTADQDAEMTAYRDELADRQRTRARGMVA